MAHTSGYKVTTTYWSACTHTIHNCTLWAEHSCFFMVTTVVNTNFAVNTFIKVCLMPSAVNFIQEDGSSSRIKGTVIVQSYFGDCYCICKMCKLQNEQHHLKTKLSQLSMKWNVTVCLLCFSAGFLCIIIYVDITSIQFETIIIYAEECSRVTNVLQLTFWSEIKLSTGNNCISGIPGVIAHSPPISLETHLHSTLQLIPTFCQSNIGVIASYRYRDTKQCKSAV